MIENKIPLDLRNRTIRRYMSYPKFLSFILEEALYFSSPYQFEDNEEAIVPEFKKATSEIKSIAIEPEIEKLSKDAIIALQELINVRKKYENREHIDKYFIFHIVNQLILRQFSNGNNVGDFNLFDLDTKSMKISECIENKDWFQTENILKDLYRRRINCHKLLKTYFKDTAIINCWNFNNNESDLLWKTYGDKGIAVETTVKKLEQALDIDNNLLCIIDKVLYDDFEKIQDKVNNISLNDMKENPELQDTSQFAFLKRKCYKQEEELRVLIRNPLRFQTKECTKGEFIKLKMQLPIFIDKIIISPYSQQNELDIIKKLFLKIGYKDIVDKIQKSQIN